MSIDRRKKIGNFSELFRAWKRCNSCESEQTFSAKSKTETQQSQRQPQPHTKKVSSLLISEKMSLSDANIFHARQILQNFRSKKSTFIDNQRNAIQILCLVSETNEILVHFKRYNDNQHVDGINVDNGVDADATINEKRMSGERKRKHSTSASNWKLIVWFQKNRKSIQDLCFDPNGSQLLVVCYDNTLHIVPILWIIDAEFGLKTTTSQEIENFYWPFRSDEITSFIVPFSGAHDCSNAKTCPNNGPTDDKVVNDERDNGDKYTPLQINEAVLSNSSYHTFYLASNDGNNQPLTPDDASDATSIAEKSPDGCEKSIVPSSNQSTESESKTESKAMSEPCPFPMSVVWWVTSKSEDPNSRQHRAIIGYSDGSICIVALTPNCPFIANTAIEVRSGGVQRMTICRDPILKSVSLLVSIGHQIQSFRIQLTRFFRFRSTQRRENNGNYYSNKTPSATYFPTTCKTVIRRRQINRNRRQPKRRCRRQNPRTVRMSGRLLFPFQMSLPIHKVNKLQMATQTLKSNQKMISFS